MNEFRNNIWHLTRMFRKLFNKYLSSKCCDEFLIYEYITCLLVIWTDTVFEIKKRLNSLDNSEFVNSLRINSKECKIILRLEVLFNDENVFNNLASKIINYLGNISIKINKFNKIKFLDSTVYYICDFMLLLENLELSFTNSLIPLLRYFSMNFIKSFYVIF